MEMCDQVLVKSGDSNNEVNPDLLWQRTADEDDLQFIEPPEMTHLLFGIFSLDKFKPLDDEHADDLLKKVYNKFAYWNTQYPWTDYSGVQLKIEALNNGSRYIFGQLCTDDIIEEANLVMAILHEISTAMGPEIFIKVCDTNGDIILPTCFDVVPEEYEYPVGNNRLWLNEGKFKMIPNYFYPNRGLLSNEVTEFLSKAPYKLMNIIELNEKITNLYINNFPESSLSKLNILSLDIEDKTSFKILQDNPRVISFLLVQLANDSLDISKIIDSAQQINPLNIIAPKTHIDSLSIYLQLNKLKESPKDISIYSGRLICKILEKLLKEDVLKFESSKISKPKIDIAHDSFEKFKFQNASMEEEVDIGNTDPLEELTKVFNNFLNEDGMPKFDKMNDPDFDSENELSDNSAKDYFKSENIDINEDDFFEFLAKNALNISDTELQNMRAQTLP